MRRPAPLEVVTSAAEAAGRPGFESSGFFHERDTDELLRRQWDDTTAELEQLSRKPPEMPEVRAVLAAALSVRLTPCFSAAAAGHATPLQPRFAALHGAYHRAAPLRRCADALPVQAGPAFDTERKDARKLWNEYTEKKAGLEQKLRYIYAEMEFRNAQVRAYAATANRKRRLPLVLRLFTPVASADLQDLSASAAAAAAEVRGSPAVYSGAQI